MGPEEVFACVEGRPGAVWLDGGPDSWSVLTWDPVETVTESGGWPAAGRALMRRGERGEVPFSSGVVGYVGYEAGHVVEPVPPGRPTPEPPVHLARYEGALCYHPSSGWHLRGAPAFRRSAEQALAQARPLPPPAAPASGPTRTLPRAEFERAVLRVQELIRSGDCYQVNLSRVVWIEEPGPPFEAYRRLRQAPARYGAYLRLSPQLAVLSNSPELFLEQRGRHIHSRPIKGTRGRSADPGQDARLRAELQGSPKDRAELTMIVDLIRNDLGKVAVTGSVWAGERQLTSHPTVHHTWWPVSAELAPEHDTWDLLAATFPPGSVTGAPKVRACERIAELEPEPRGIYCGAIGYVDDSGDSTWSVAIRMAVLQPTRARYHVGGGIVAGSEPSAEWEETVTKETALRRALIGAG
jgi:para-aminobenzoate synthetase component 1